MQGTQINGVTLFRSLSSVPAGIAGFVSLENVICHPGIVKRGPVSVFETLIRKYFNAKEAFQVKKRNRSAYKKVELQLYIQKRRPIFFYWLSGVILIKIVFYCFFVRIKYIQAGFFKH